MSLESRITELERKQGMQDDLSLCGVLYFHENLIIIDGVTYTHVEDIPASVRAKHGEHLKVGTVTAPDGRSADVVAASCDGPGHLP